MRALSHVRQIDYTVIFARDLEAMRHFYEDVLEFPRWRSGLAKAMHISKQPDATKKNRHHKRQRTDHSEESDSE